ncbi:MAG: transcription termination factor NusA [Clostridiales bacterium]|jgi:N utilization substance protein A|nr:transcription termination factor NusA [Clostridiales bacterium]
MPANSELIDTIGLIEKEKGIDKEILFEAIESSLISACKKNFGTSQNIRVSIDRNNGAVNVFAQKEVVEEIEDATLQVSLEEAREINLEYNIGDIVEFVVTPRDFGRISAQTAKQVVVQKFREAERNKIIKEFKDREYRLLSGVVERIEGRNVFIAVGQNELILLPAEQIPGEQYYVNQRIKVLVLDIKESGGRGPLIPVSRTHPDLVARLFEQEVPEVADGTVVIRAVAREAGHRTKIAVASLNTNVDPVGSCVGAGGQRVNVVVNELNGEKIDIISHSDNPKEFIAAALSPAIVLAVRVEAGGKAAKIVVPDNQLSLAIGREGQNARLAAKLTGFRIDIKSYSKALEEGFISNDDMLGDEEEAAPAADAAVVDEAQYAEAAAEYYEYDDDDYDDEYDDEYDEYDEYDDEYDDAAAEGDDNKQD